MPLSTEEPQHHRIRIVCLGAECGPLLLPVVLIPILHGESQAAHRAILVGKRPCGVIIAVLIRPGERNTSIRAKPRLVIIPVQENEPAAGLTQGGQLAAKIPALIIFLDIAVKDTLKLRHALVPVLLFDREDHGLGGMGGEEGIAIFQHILQHEPARPGRSAGSASAETVVQAEPVPTDGKADIKIAEAVLKLLLQIHLKIVGQNKHALKMDLRIPMFPSNHIALNYEQFFFPYQSLC